HLQEHVFERRPLGPEVADGKVKVRRQADDGRHELVAVTADRQLVFVTRHGVYAWRCAELRIRGVVVGDEHDGTLGTVPADERGGGGGGGRSAPGAGSGGD